VRARVSQRALTRPSELNRSVLLGRSNENIPHLTPF
jgi:hypothetical protein